jgi:hypothetical protein
VASKRRVEAHTSYAGGPPEFQEASRGEAIRSLATFLGITEVRAMDALADGSAAEEIRSARGLSVGEARRVMELKFLGS